jgi:hypothetical protein
LSHIIPSGY